ncbi:hypothetical protein ABIB82_006117 [Bradyrhizobium sp. i1.8.4]
MAGSHHLDFPQQFDCIMDVTSESEAFRSFAVVQGLHLLELHGDA